jgi:hypothetical protein
VPSANAQDEDSSGCRLEVALVTGLAGSLVPEPPLAKSARMVLAIPGQTAGHALPVGVPGSHSSGDTLDRWWIASNVAPSFFEGTTSPSPHH